MRPHSLVLMIVSVMLVATASQGFGASQERLIGLQEKQAVLVHLDRDAATNSDITAFFWVREPRCKAPDRAAVFILSERLADAPEAQVRSVAQQGVLAIQRLCGASFSHGTINVVVAPPWVTLDVNGQLQPPAIASLTVEFYEHSASSGVSITKYVNSRAPQQRWQERIARIDTEDGVEAWPSIEPLMTNPYVYQGKVIAMPVTFQQMISPADGVFEAGKGALVVSDIPEGLLVSPGRAVVVGVVLGQREASFPMVGKILVPHLKFIDIFKCSTGDLPCKEVLDKKFQ